MITKTEVIAVEELAEKIKKKLEWRTVGANNYSDSLTTLTSFL